MSELVKFNEVRDIQELSLSYLVSFVVKFKHPCIIPQADDELPTVEAERIAPVILIFRSIDNRVGFGSSVIPIHGPFEIRHRNHISPRYYIQPDARLPENSFSQPCNLRPRENVPGA